jgi:hypothetical protein
VSEAQRRRGLGDAATGKPTSSRVCCNGKESERNEEAERTTTSSNEGRDHYRMLKGLTSFTLSLFEGVDIKVKEARSFARVD